MLLFMGLNIFFIILSLIIGLIMQMNLNNGVFFGIRIPLGYEKKEELQYEKKRYNRMWLIVWSISSVFWIIAMNLVSEEYSATVLIGTLFSQLILANICYYIVYRRVKAIKKENNWKELLTKDNIKYVDLKIRSDIAKSLNKKWIIVPIAILWINVIATFTKNNTNGIIILIIQVMLFITMHLSIKAIIKTKVNFNGGDVEHLKKQKLIIRRYLMKMLLVTEVFIMFLFTFINFAILDIISSRFIIPIFIIILGFTLIILIVNCVQLIKFNKIKENFKEEEINSKRVAINRDDDDNYLMGMIYYNPNDPDFMVEKRDGMGMTVNLGTIGGKIFTIITAIIIIGSLGATFIIPKMMRSQVNLTENNLEVKGIYSSNINYKNIKNIEYLDNLPKVNIRTNGAAIGNKKYGYFKLEFIGDAKLYIENSELPCIEIILKEGNHIYINLDNEDETMKLYKKLKKTLIYNN
ncbi:DUF5808 domain-containing protein [Clostridium fallax]|uniref:Uncharacterized membrane protein n=1 Tax=Clostridium fallax TaxID=1533 RepID=A0A1M4XR45_9CLOT|nr:DUF5808 domain-containing protein [Clostridium fallax]SHE95890.1 Uncharacterized membrane protein [Clostridium fallax]SQB08075.1 membrane protein [Clostridium fallax]